MLVTTNWINDYLKNDVSPEEQARLLTAAGFPLEERLDLPDGDVRQDFEMTSNRGDCTCHLGLAREISAKTDNTLLSPSCDIEESNNPIGDEVSVENMEKELCPLYTARVILGATVKESPTWLKKKIENRGDVPRNAIVDATNFILFEQGQPTHVFDLDKLAGRKIIVRMAKDGETFLPLGEDSVEIKLTTKDLVIADEEKPVALAGVKGGALASVTDDTKNLLIESATFNPVIVREMSRRHKIYSDSSFRFERGVNARQVKPCANRLANVLLEVGGGKVCNGILQDGKELPNPINVTMRTSYCCERLGFEIQDEQIVEHLSNVGFETTCTDGVVTSVVPCYRGDIHREIDLVEEVARVHGYENIPVEETIEVSVPPSGGEAAGKQAVLNVLAGMGFVECVTHSLVSIGAANQFLLDNESPLLIDDDRATAEPALRPSLLPSLLTVKKYNEDNGVNNVRLSELGSVFVIKDGIHKESSELALILDSEEDNGISELRGVIDRIHSVLTATTSTTVTPSNDAPWLEPGGDIIFNGNSVGRIGRLSTAVQKIWDLSNTTHVAQLNLSSLFASFPPDVQSHPLPKQPAIERDVSIIVTEDVLWSNVFDTIMALGLPLLEDVAYITTFRGKNIETGKKSLTLRLRFRDATRTLTHDEVNAPATLASDALQQQLGAEIRS
ncbi:MAG: phenylalanine--tRNA ligase subunit beta [Phycisphaerae bacterium]|jgi:phenylalanyl-tRNA synthetase beta chain|nr:phenylalanine--tRNA ligase subunit beta [Phycisphaerae bacterium]